MATEQGQNKQLLERSGTLVTQVLLLASVGQDCGGDSSRVGGRSCRRQGRDRELHSDGDCDCGVDAPNGFFSHTRGGVYPSNYRPPMPNSSHGPSMLMGLRGMRGRAKKLERFHLRDIGELPWYYSGFVEPPRVRNPPMAFGWWPSVKKESKAVSKSQCNFTACVESCTDGNTKITAITRDETPTQETKRDRLPCTSSASIGGELSFDARPLTHNSTFWRPADNNTAEMPWYYGVYPCHASSLAFLENSASTAPLAFGWSSFVDYLCGKPIVLKRIPDVADSDQMPNYTIDGSRQGEETHTVSIEPKVGQRPPNNYQTKMPWYYEPYFGPYQPLAFATAKTCAKSLAYSLNIGDMWSKKPPEGVPISKASPANLEKDTLNSTTNKTVYSYPWYYYYFIRSPSKPVHKSVGNFLRGMLGRPTVNDTDATSELPSWDRSVPCKPRDHDLDCKQRLAMTSAGRESKSKRKARLGAGITRKLFFLFGMKDESPVDNIHHKASNVTWSTLAHGGYSTWPVINLGIFQHLTGGSPPPTPKRKGARLSNKVAFLGWHLFARESPLVLPSQNRTPTNHTSKYDIAIELFLSRPGLAFSFFSSRKKTPPPPPETNGTSKYDLAPWQRLHLDLIEESRSRHPFSLGFASPSSKNKTTPMAMNLSSKYDLTPWQRLHLDLSGRDTPPLCFSFPFRKRDPTPPPKNITYKYDLASWPFCFTFPFRKEPSPPPLKRQNAFRLPFNLSIDDFCANCEEEEDEESPWDIFGGISSFFGGGGHRQDASFANPFSRRDFELPHEDKNNASASLKKPSAFLPYVDHSPTFCNGEAFAFPYWKRRFSTPSTEEPANETASFDLSVIWPHVDHSPTFRNEPLAFVSFCGRNKEKGAEAADDGLASSWLPFRFPRCILNLSLPRIDHSTTLRNDPTAFLIPGSNRDAPPRADVCSTRSVNMSLPYVDHFPTFRNDAPIPSSPAEQPGRVPGATAMRGLKRLLQPVRHLIDKISTAGSNVCDQEQEQVLLAWVTPDELAPKMSFTKNRSPAVGFITPEDFISKMTMAKNKSIADVRATAPVIPPPIPSTKGKGQRPLFIFGFRDILNADESSKETAPVAKSSDVVKGLDSMSKCMRRANDTNIREKKARGLRNVCKGESNNETESEIFGSFQKILLSSRMEEPFFFVDSLRLRGGARIQLPRWLIQEVRREFPEQIEVNDTTQPPTSASQAHFTGPGARLESVPWWRWPPGSLPAYGGLAAVLPPLRHTNVDSRQHAQRLVSHPSTSGNTPIGAKRLEKEIARRRLVEPKQGARMAVAHQAAELGKKKTEWFNPASEDGSERETAKVLVPVQVPTNRQTKTYKHAHLKDEREAKEAKLLSSKREAQLVHDAKRAERQRLAEKKEQEISRTRRRMARDFERDQHVLETKTTQHARHAQQVNDNKHPQRIPQAQHIRFGHDAHGDEPHLRVQLDLPRQNLSVMSLRGGGGAAGRGSEGAAARHSSKRQAERRFGKEVSEHHRRRFYNDTLDDAPLLPDVYLCPFPGFCFVQSSDSIDVPKKSFIRDMMSPFRNLLIHSDADDNCDLSFLSRTQSTPCRTPASRRDVGGDASNQTSNDGKPSSPRHRQWPFNKLMTFFSFPVGHRSKPHAAVDKKATKQAAEASFDDSMSLHPSARFPGFYCFSFPRSPHRTCCVNREKRHPNCTMWEKPYAAPNNKSRNAAKGSIAFRFGFVEPSDTKQQQQNQQQQQTSMNMTWLNKMLYEWPGYLFFADASSLAAHSSRFSLPVSAGRSTPPIVATSVGMRMDKDNPQREIDVFTNLGRSGADDSLPLMAEKRMLEYIAREEQIARRQLSFVNHTGYTPEGWAHNTSSSSAVARHAAGEVMATSPRLSEVPHSRKWMAEAARARVMHLSNGVCGEPWVTHSNVSSEIKLTHFPDGDFWLSRAFPNAASGGLKTYMTTTMDRSSDHQFGRIGKNRRAQSSLTAVDDNFSTRYFSHEGVSEWSSEPPEVGDADEEMFWWTAGDAEVLENPHQHPDRVLTPPFYERDPTPVRPRLASDERDVDSGGLRRDGTESIDEMTGNDQPHFSLGGIRAHAWFPPPKPGGVIGDEANHVGFPPSEDEDTESATSDPSQSKSAWATTPPLSKKRAVEEEGRGRTTLSRVTDGQGTIRSLENEDEEVFGDNAAMRGRTTPEMDCSPEEENADCKQTSDAAADNGEDEHRSEPDQENIECDQADAVCKERRAQEELAKIIRVQEKERGHHCTQSMWW